MYPRHLSNYVIRESQTAPEALWLLEKQKFLLKNFILAVLDKDEKYIGLITPSAIDEALHANNPMEVYAGDICDRNGHFCKHTSPPPPLIPQSSPQIRSEAMTIFADNDQIYAIPVIDSERNLVDIIFHQQVFYKDYLFGKMSAKAPGFLRMSYAYPIYCAASLAKALGYDSFSVIEFGVAGGNGLAHCEFHIKEISRLFGLNIELYGFDTGAGMPVATDKHDLKYIFQQGFYKMDYESLLERLQFAKLEIGDIKQTARRFIHERSFAPIGVMLVDVDYYSSTVPILDMLREGTDNFLPRVHMFFDDVGHYLEHEGEMRAIKEFNETCNEVKISRHEMSIYSRKELRGAIWENHLFCAHLFNHSKYDSLLNRDSPLVKLI